MGEVIGKIVIVLFGIVVVLLAFSSFLVGDITEYERKEKK